MSKEHYICRHTHMSSSTTSSLRPSLAKWRLPLAPEEDADEADIQDEYLYRS